MFSRTALNAVQPDMKYFLQTDLINLFSKHKAKVPYACRYLSILFRNSTELESHSTRIAYKTSSSSPQLHLNIPYLISIGSTTTCILCMHNHL